MEGGEAEKNTIFDSNDLERTIWPRKRFLFLFNIRQRVKNAKKYPNLISVIRPSNDDIPPSLISDFAGNTSNSSASSDNDDWKPTELKES